MENNYTDNFEKIWNGHRNLILNLEIENLKSILYSDKLKNGCQQTVWQVIHDWVISNKENRLTHLPNLLKKNLQFDRLTKHYVEENIFKNVIFKLLPISYQTDLKNFVQNVKFQNELIHDSFNLPDILSPVINYQKLLCINRKNGYFEYNEHNSWYSSSFSLQPPGEQYEYQLELLGSLLYAFGGHDSDYNTTNQMWSRDMSDPSSQWTARADMKQSRTWFCSVVLNDTIYALGGIDENYQPLRSCERYCSQLNEWSTVADMNSERAGASAAVINGCIYVAGGKDNRWSVSKYCPETDTWREVAPMTTQRYYFALTPFDDRLWAIGGLGGDRHPLSSCESYDPVSDTWQEEAPMKEERWRHEAIEFNGELYVVGGFKKIEKDDPVLAVEKYQPYGKWIKSGTLQKGIIDAKLIIVLSVLFKYCYN